MNGVALSQDAVEEVRRLRNVEIVIGIPSYNNARTIGHVVRAAQVGLVKYFPQYKAVIVNSDGGSRDSTRDEVLRAQVEQPHTLMLKTPLLPVNKLSLPYHGIPGKGSAFRMIFEMAVALDANACAVVDADLRSITPEWFDLLVRPILFAGYDFVAPYYHRHKYDGTITNSIVYPLTRSLYGLRVRQPIGGEFGLSVRLLRRLIERKDWETDVARYGIDIWLTTIAMAEGFRVCQSFLGAKLHDAKDPGADLSAMLHQVVGSVFQLMPEYSHVWQSTNGSRDVDLFGFRFDVGLEPIPVNIERMINTFFEGCEHLKEVWGMALPPELVSALLDLRRKYSDNQAAFHLEDGLWVKIIHRFASAHHRMPLERGHLLRSLTPLYLARVASFFVEAANDGAAEVEERIEKLCLAFEREKPNLIRLWNNIPEAEPPAEAESAVGRQPAGGVQEPLEVRE